jgi:uncharacterized protein
MSARRLVYLDTSAFVKLVQTEPESPALRLHLEQRSAEIVSAVLLRTEALRAAARQPVPRIGPMRAALRGVAFIDVDRPVFDAAGTVQPADMRSLDAIHVVAALSLGDDLDELITYDVRMAAAAVSHGLSVSSPR